MPRMLVTGGNGFIGSNLARALESLGHAVVSADLELTASPATLTGFQGERVTLDAAIRWQIAGPFTAVFHQAALTDPRHHDDREIFEKNVHGMENAIAFALEKNAKLIYASTAGLYGNGPIPMHEDQPKEILTAYGRSKLVMDQLAERHFAQLPIVGLRYFNVFGMGEAGKGRPASMIYHLGNQIRETGKARIFTSGEQVRDHIYVKDVVTANLCAIESRHSGIYNVGTGVGTSFNSLVALLGAILDRPVTIEYFPMPYAASTYQSHTLADTAKAAAELGFVSHWELGTAIGDYYRHLGWI